MSTPIETNTEELNEILQTVYNLPNRSSGGSAEPDLVIGLNVADTKMWKDGTTDSARHLLGMTAGDVSIVSGSVSATADKVKQGLPVRVLIKSIHFYWSDWWFTDIGEATQVLLANWDSYPNENYTRLQTVFFLSNTFDAIYKPAILRIAFDLATGEVDSYQADAISVGTLI